MRHTISVLVTNEFGVLSRISGLFSGRGFNIESLSVAETLDPQISRMTIVTSGDDKVLEQINKQLNKLVNVIKVYDFTSEEHIERELALIKVNLTAETRAEIISIVDIFRAKVVDVSPRTYTVEITGDEEKIRAMTELLRPFGIKEIVRTGRVAMARSPKQK
ncbi:MAG TPA: acetolactate synthase small subunit [Deltaproteobacteria bacterium]|nr:MAG: acetolactate synthase small subunit [Deltaproteobacteria bacterium GWA2_55_82]OGQ63276.1 MAG: acetolactate synthase small subunit [Deltaproteobacteria bacterium RIFCSPLOWO2_02_FULL_55_12]OIJ73111.1 MAG: acetolactate synthase small subunit [Deltaproteobacteria bacterium GWC2_55_46]HBG47877.1 acetolactate synthase small subunit [Deltaproteobacteria bacterium]HCY11860.1 acetolactate synthase small subunit [Deltaproteobacteria bacterium]